MHTIVQYADVQLSYIQYVRLYCRIGRAVGLHGTLGEGSFKAVSARSFRQNAGACQAAQSDSSFYVDANGITVNDDNVG